jgi:hypothetical protein
VLAVTFAVAGCAIQPAISGFRPVYPPLTGSIFTSPYNLGDFLNWPTVDSLQPTLRWQPFPGEHEHEIPSLLIGPGFYKGTGEAKPFVEVDLGLVSEVKYDLRIWTVLEGIPGELAYEIEGLTGPFHKLERPLKPSAEYYWSVRARFSLDGQLRLSEWSLSQAPCPSYPECARYVARLTGRIPPPNYYRFKTPRQ